MNNFWLIWVPSLAAAMASLVGVWVAVSQLGSVSRWRQTATFWKEQVTVTNPAYDEEVARSLYREAASRVVALQAYPGWKLSGFLLLPVLGATTLSGILGYFLPERDETFLWWFSVVNILSLWVFIFWGLQEISHVLDRRQIMAYLFLLKQELSSKTVESVFHTRSFKDRLYPDYTGLLLLSTGLFVFAVSLGVAAKGFKEGDPDLIFGLLVTVIFPVLGCALIGFGYLLSRFYENRHWLHPQRLGDSSEQPEMTVDSSIPE